MRIQQYDKRADGGSYGLPWPIGTKIVFTGEGGMKCELEIGKEYTVKHGQVFGYSSIVELKEVKGGWNTSMFKEICMKNAYGQCPKCGA